MKQKNPHDTREGTEALPWMTVMMDGMRYLLESPGTSSLWPSRPYLKLRVDCQWPPVLPPAISLWAYSSSQTYPFPFWLPMLTAFGNAALVHKCPMAEEVQKDSCVSLSPPGSGQELGVVRTKSLREMGWERCSVMEEASDTT